MKMPTALSPIAAIALIMLSSACATKPPRDVTEAKPQKIKHHAPLAVPPLETRLAPAWISSATRLQAGSSVIYYHGSAERASAEGAPWAGMVRGDILLLSPVRAIVIPSGSLEVRGETTKIVGASSTQLAGTGEPPKWQRYLAE